MRDTRRKFFAGLIFILLVGLITGWVYDRPLLGLLIATAVALAWQTKHLLALRERYVEASWTTFDMATTSGTSLSPTSIFSRNVATDTRNSTETC